MSLYNITFESVLRGGGNQLYLSFPGKYGSRFGPFPEQKVAWEYYVRVAREVYFHFTPETAIVRELEDYTGPTIYVPSIDFQI